MTEKVFDKTYEIRSNGVNKGALTRAANRFIAEYAEVFGKWSVSDEIKAIAEKIKQAVIQASMNMKLNMKRTAQEAAMKVSDCRQCEFCTCRAWSHYYKPNNYHGIGMSHAYEFCTKYNKRTSAVKYCSDAHFDKGGGND